MKLASIVYGTQETVALVWGDDLVDFGRGLQIYRLTKAGEAGPVPRSIQDLFGQVPGGKEFHRYLADVVSFLDRHNYWVSLKIGGSPRLRPPVARPGQILCLARNYAAHAAETSGAPPTEPIYFAKSPRAVIGQEEPVIYPAGAERIDPEVELAVVIGRRCRKVRREEALEYVAGYTILNDITDRHQQQLDIQAKQPWYRSKSYDTFCPMGPVLVLTDEIPDPQALELTLRVNGEVRQHASTSEMLFPVAQIIEAISQHITLEPGDVIATGTPQGIAPIRPGDVVECDIPGIGKLRNPVVEEKAPATASPSGS